MKDKLAVGLRLVLAFVVGGIAGVCRGAGLFFSEVGRLLQQDARQLLPEAYRPELPISQTYWTHVEELDFELQIELEIHGLMAEHRRSVFVDALREASKQVLLTVTRTEAGAEAHEAAFRHLRSAARQAVANVNDEDTFDRFKADPYVARADARHEPADNGSGIRPADAPEEELIHVG